MSQPSTVSAKCVGKPVFIGNFRSGTTLLVNLLGLHGEFVPWFETKWMCEALRYLRVLTEPGQRDYEASLTTAHGPDVFTVSAVAERMLDDIRGSAARIGGWRAHGKAPHERYLLGHDFILYTVEQAEEAVRRWSEQVTAVDDPETVARSTGSLINRLGDLQAQLSGKPCWLNKTPEICRFGRELRQCLGSARIILMIRNGRDVVRSAESLGWAEVRQLAAWWRGMIEQSREAAAGYENDYLEVRYETLVDQPVEELNRILRFLGMEESGVELVTKYQQEIAISPISSGAPLALGEASQVGQDRLEDLFDGEFMASLGYA